MIVTINTAAGFYGRERRGAYAYWITSDLGSIKQAGPLLDVESKDQANLLALAKALEVLYKTDFNNVERIFVESGSADLFKKISRKDLPESAAARCYLWLKNLQKKFYLVYHQFTALPHGPLKGCALWCDEAVNQIVNIKQKA